jgi:hypothetical protein
MGVNLVLREQRLGVLGLSRDERQSLVKDSSREGIESTE